VEKIKWNDTHPHMPANRVMSWKGKVQRITWRGGLHAIPRLSLSLECSQATVEGRKIVRKSMDFLQFYNNFLLKARVHIESSSYKKQWRCEDMHPSPVPKNPHSGRKQPSLLCHRRPQHNEGVQLY
jgi:hypothetical protein